MKKIFMLLSIVLVGNMLINSCIYDKVCEGEASIITPPDTTIVNPPSGDATKKTYYLRFNTGNIDDVVTYAFPDLNISSVLKWSSSESAGVYMYSGSYPIGQLNKKYNFSFSGVNNRTYLSFDTVTTSLQNAVVYGYVPYQSNFSGSSIFSTLNSVQDQSVSADSSFDDTSLKKNMFLISGQSPSFSINEGTGMMEYKSIFAFLRFQVLKNSSFTTFNTQNLRGVKLYIADENNIETPLNYILAGDYTIDVSKAIGSSDYVGPIFSSSSSMNSITASISGGDYITESLVSSPYVWFVINPIKINSNERLVSIMQTSEGYNIISTHDISELKANSVYSFKVEASESNTVSDNYITTYYAPDSASNCYIVSRAGLCQIPLNKKSGVSLSGTTVDWLWASKEGGSSSFDISELIDPSTFVYDPIAHCVRFRVGSSFGKFTKGNVILALKDASGNIVWTWHIWITDKPEDIAYDNLVFLDRNLGALSVDINNSPAVDTYGFVYQWGRKDPFFGGDGVIYDEATSILETARMHTIVNTSTWNYVEKAIGGDLDYSIKHPMSFIYNKGSESSWKKDPADWLSTSNASLWSATSKTDYDPCPDGYRVPSKGDFYILHLANGTTPIAFDKYSEKYWKFDNSSSVSYWPAAGMRQGRQNLSSDNLYGAQLKYSGTNMLEGQCYYWASTPFSVGGTPLLGASYRIHTVSDKLYSEDEYGDNADAYPIRCVKE